MVQGAENDLKDIRFYTNTSTVDFVTDIEPLQDLNDNTLTVDNKAIVAKTLANQAVDDFSGSHQGDSGASAHTAATDTTAGFMSAADKAKLDRIQPEAQINIISPVDALELVGGGATVLHTHISVSTINDGIMLAADKAKLNGIAAGANVNQLSNSVADLLARSPGVDANSLHTHTTPTFVEVFTEAVHDVLPDHSIFPGVPPAFPGFTKADEFNIGPDQDFLGQTIFANGYPFVVAALTAGMQRFQSTLFPWGWGGQESFTIDDITAAVTGPGTSTGTVTYSVVRLFSAMAPGTHLDWFSHGHMACYQSGYAD